MSEKGYFLSKYTFFSNEFSFIQPLFKNIIFLGRVVCLVLGHLIHDPVHAVGQICVQWRKLLVAHILAFVVLLWDSEADDAPQEPLRVLFNDQAAAAVALACGHISYAKNSIKCQLIRKMVTHSHCHQWVHRRKSWRPAWGICRKTAAPASSNRGGCAPAVFPLAAYPADGASP